LYGKCLLQNNFETFSGRQFGVHRFSKAEVAQMGVFYVCSPHMTGVDYAVTKMKPRLIAQGSSVRSTSRWRRPRAQPSRCPRRRGLMTPRCVLFQ
jgi:hypothetical protein